MKTVREQSVAQNMRLTSTEKDMLKRLIEDDHTEKCIIAYFITALAHKSEPIRTIANKFSIKANWANTAYEIGKKLWFKDINRVKRMKRDTPMRLEGAA